MKAKRLRRIVLLALSSFILSSCAIFDVNGNTSSSVTSESEGNEIESFSLDKSTLSLYVGDTYTFTPIFKPDGTSASINWGSSNTAVASIKSGVLTAKRAGTAQIIAKSAGFTATCAVTVNKALVEVESISLSGQGGLTSVALGNTLQLSASYTPSDTTQTELTWTSEDENILTVSNSGLVTGINEGTANVIATSVDKPSIYGSISIEITDGQYPASISLPEYLYLEVGETRTLNVSYYPISTSVKEATFTSSNESVASISSAGLITGNAAGTVTINVEAKASKGGATVSASTTVVVTQTQSVSKTSIDYNYHDYTDNSMFDIDSCPTTGNVKLLVIPVWFTNSSSFIAEDHKDYVRQDIESIYFGDDASIGWKSVKSYYEEESKNRINITGTVSDWYQASITSNQAGTYSASNVSSLVYSAVDWYFTNNPTDSRKNYDSDGNGHLDGVMLIYGAPDYRTANNSYTNLWAYCYWTQKADASIANPTPSVYFWASYDFMYSSSKANERTGYSYGGGDCSNATLDAHTYIHEMGHVFGLDDYYDYNNVASPAGNFSMQDYNVGSHDAFSVMAYGYADPYIPTSSCSLTIHSFQASNDLILLTPSWNTYNSPFDEYLLLELYTPTGLNEFDVSYQYKGRYPQGPDAVGIRLWHVDARLTRYSSYSGYSTSLTSNPLVGNVKTAMANTTYIEDGSKNNYCSPLGADYYNYNLLQLIRNDTSKTYLDNTTLASSDLFKDGSSFNMSTYSSQFANSNKLNSSISLGWSFTVSISGSGSSAYATVNLTKI